MFTRGLTWKERKLYFSCSLQLKTRTGWHQISSSCWWFLLFEERFGSCVSIWWKERGPLVDTNRPIASCHCSPSPNVFITPRGHEGPHHTQPLKCTCTHSFKHTHTLLSQDWLVYQFACGMLEWGGGGGEVYRGDEYKNTHEEWKNTEDFCVQVRGKVI